MACRINFTLRCPPSTPKCPLQHPKSPHLPPPPPPLTLLSSSSTAALNPLKLKMSCSGTSRHGYLTVKSHMAAEDKPISGDRMLVFVPPHPLIKHWVSVLRNEQTPSPIFRNAMAELGRLLIYEASRDWMPTVTGEIQSPLGVASVEFIDPREPVVVIPILRAGLALAEHASSILPATKTHHLELYGCTFAGFDNFDS